jgi:hypothetical protein
MLIPEFRAAWNNEALVEFIKRWTFHGLWTLPDPCAKTDPGPTYTGTCVSGSGRFPSLHGGGADNASYIAKFTIEMWDNYKGDEVAISDKGTRVPVILRQDVRVFPQPVNSYCYFDAISLPRVSRMQVTVYNEVGQQVRTLAKQGNIPAVYWNGNDAAGRQAPAGMYFYSVKVDGTVHSGRLLKTE